jgi:hypothetical protein
MTSKEEFANYVIAIMEAWKKGEEIEYRELLSPESIWRNISEIPPNETLWVFEYRHFRVKPKSIPATEEELEAIELLGLAIKHKADKNGTICQLSYLRLLPDGSNTPKDLKDNYLIFDPITKTWQDWGSKI